MMKNDLIFMAEGRLKKRSFRHEARLRHEKFNINNNLRFMADGGSSMADRFRHEGKNPVTTGPVARFFSTAETPIYKYIGRHFSCLPDYILDMFCASNFGGVNDE